MKGRPRQYIKREIITTSVDGNIMEKYREICDRERIDYNGPIKKFLADFVQKKEEQRNPQTTLDSKAPAVPSIFAPIQDKEYWFGYHKNNTDLIQQTIWGLQEYVGLFTKAGFRF